MIKALSRQEMLELVKKIRVGEGSDREVSHWIERISDSVPNREVVQTIMSGDDLSDEEIVNKLYVVNTIYP